MNFVYNHLHFRSEDPDAAAKFYCDNFGAKITSERPMSTTKSIQIELNGHHLMTISMREQRFQCGLRREAVEEVLGDCF